LDTAFPFSNTLIRRTLILKSKNDLWTAHAGDDTIVARNVVRWGYKIVKIQKILGVHYHSNPVGHAKMEFYRTGKEVTKDSRTFGLRIIITKFAQLSIDWLRFSSYSQKFNLSLYRFLLRLYFELVKGVVDGYFN
jgi:hypothetical protein